MHIRGLQRKPHLAVILPFCLGGLLGGLSSGLAGEWANSGRRVPLGPIAAGFLAPASAQLPPKSLVKLRYDGLYASFNPRENFTQYLRFYADGTVRSVNLLGDIQAPAELGSRFAQAGGTASQGTYKLETSREGERIQFITTSPSPKTITVSYTGLLGRGELNLASLSLSNGFAEQRAYRFVPVAFTDLASPDGTEPAGVQLEKQPSEGQQSQTQQSEIQQSLSTPQLAPSDAGLAIAPSEAPDRWNRIVLWQPRYVSEKIIRERGVEFVDRCSDKQEAVGTRGITDYGSDELPLQAIAPTLFGRADAKVWFRSKTTAPAPGLRVMIRNASQATSVKEMPYSDRDYSQGQASEGFTVGRDNGHQTRFLAVNGGVNRFMYEIRRGSEVIESGEFEAAFGEQYADQTRVVTIARPKVNMTCVKKRKQ